MATDPGILQVQRGAESTWATAVPPTARLRGVKDFSVKPNSDVEVVEELRGTLVPGYQAVVKRVSGAADLTARAYYEDVAWLLDDTFGVAVPGAATTYTRSYSAPVGTKPTLRGVTWVFGDFTEGDYKLEGGLVKSLTFTAGLGSILEVKAALVGSKVTGSGGLIANPTEIATATPVVTPQCAMYLDTWAGTMGSTALSAALFDWELVFEPGTDVEHYQGSLTPLAYVQKKWSGSLKFAVELKNTTKAQLDALTDMTAGVWQKQLRFKFTSGTSILQFDFAGTAVKSPDIFTEKNNTVAFEVEMKPTYHTTLATWAKIDATAGVQTLP